MNIQWVQNDYLTKGRSCWRESSGSCGWLSRIYRKYQLNLVTTKTLLKTTEGQSAQELKCHQAIWRMIWGLKIIYISEISVYCPALCVGMYYCLLQPPCSLSLIQSVKLISALLLSVFISPQNRCLNILCSPTKAWWGQDRGDMQARAGKTEGEERGRPVMTSCKKGNQTSSVCAHVLLLETLIY